MTLLGACGRFVGRLAGQLGSPRRRQQHRPRVAELSSTSGAGAGAARRGQSTRGPVITYLQDLLVVLELRNDPLALAEQQRGRRLGILFTVGDLTSAVGPPLTYGVPLFGLGTIGLIPLLGLRGVYMLSAGIFAAMFLVTLWWVAARRRLPGS